jgi:hypothetical protein
VNSFHITGALASERRADLLRQADEHRHAAAGAGPALSWGAARWFPAMRGRRRGVARDLGLAPAGQAAPPSPGMGPSGPSPAGPTWSDPVVVRRIKTPPSEVAQRIVWEGEPPARVGLGRLGELRVGSHIRSDGSGPGEVWLIPSRLVGSGPRIVRFSRVDIEIRPASSQTVELRLLPRSRHIHRWGTRRHRRYFQLAHAAADQVAQRFAA